MRLRLMFVTAFCVCVTSPAAAEQRRIWDLSSETTDPGAFPYRIIQRFAAELQFVSAGRPAEVVRVFANGPTDVSILSPDDANAAFASDAFRFTLSGNMALFVPPRGPRAYVRAFDFSQRAFSQTEAFLFKSRPAFVVGENHIAAFEKLGQRHPAFPPDTLELRVIGHDGTAFSSQQLWASSLYTHFVAMDVNAKGDVAAVVAQYGAPGTTVYRCQLLVARRGQVNMYPIGEDLSCPNAIALSPDATTVAIGLDASVVVYDVSGIDLTALADIPIGKCVPNASSRPTHIALNNEGRVGVWVQVFEDGKPPGNWGLVVAGANGDCETLARYNFGELYHPLVRFIRNDRLYVGAQVVSQSDAPVAFVFDVK